MVADLACCHEEEDRASIGNRDGVHLGVHDVLRLADQTASLVAWPPLIDRRLVDVLCSLRDITSIISVFGRVASAIRPFITRAKPPLSLRRFQRLSSILVGASRHRKPLRLIKTIPMKTRWSRLLER
jgi:hypothetical protein